MQKREGFIALISTIIISVILLSIALSLSFSGFYARFNILETEFKDRSLSLAEACGDTALLKLVNNNSYTGNETTTIGNLTCHIFGVSAAPSTGNFVFNTDARFPQPAPEQAVTILRITADSSTLSVISWEEIPN